MILIRFTKDLHCHIFNSALTLNFSGFFSPPLTTDHSASWHWYIYLCLSIIGHSKNDFSFKTQLCKYYWAHIPDFVLVLWVLWLYPTHIFNSFYCFYWPFFAHRCPFVGVQFFQKFWVRVVNQIYTCIYQKQHLLIFLWHSLFVPILLNAGHWTGSF